MLNADPMGELIVSNELLGHREKMDEVYERDGYLYFREVLDEAALLEVKQGMAEILVAHGVGAAEGSGVSWTGKVGAPDQRLFAEAGLWQAFVRKPVVSQLIEQILGETPFFIEVAGFNYNVPDGEPAYPHQDGFYIPGVPFRTFWIPLMPIDESLGGLAVAAGSHKLGWLHKVDIPAADGDSATKSAASAIPSRRAFSVPADAFPADSWRRANFAFGDLLVFSPRTLHTGLPNSATDGRIRLSMNVRAQPASAPRPSILRLDALGVRDHALEGMQILADEGVPEAQLHPLYCELFERDIDLTDRDAVREVITVAGA